MTPGRIKILERRGQWKLGTGKLESGSLSRPLLQEFGHAPYHLEREPRPPSCWSDGTSEICPQVCDRDLAMDASFEPLPVSLGC